MIEADAGVERHDSRGGFLILWTEAVRPAVVGVKVGMSLEDEVDLAGKPEARVLEMREHRFGIGSGGGGWGGSGRRGGRVVGCLGRIVRTCRGSVGLRNWNWNWSWSGCFRLLRVCRDYACRGRHQRDHGEERRCRPAYRFAIALPHLPHSQFISMPLSV